MLGLIAFSCVRLSVLSNLISAAMRNQATITVATRCLVLLTEDESFVVSNDVGMLELFTYDAKLTDNVANACLSLLRRLTPGSVYRTYLQHHQSRSIFRMFWTPQHSPLLPSPPREVTNDKGSPHMGFRSWSLFLAVNLQVTWVINPAVGCHYFPPGLQLPSQPIRGLLPILLLGEQRHNGCEQFA